MSEDQFAISVTPDLALDIGYTYAGGLGVLEGDKFYAAARIGIKYIVATLFYRNGYVDYEFDSDGVPRPKPQQQPEEFIKSLTPEDRFRIGLKGFDVEVEPLVYRSGSAKAVFFNIISPEWASRFCQRIYIENGVEEKFYKYTILAKAVAEYIRRNIKLEDVAYIDLQEAYTALLPLQLKIPGRYRLVIHTAGIWGHPSFPRDLLTREYGYRFIEPEVFLTEIGLATAQHAFAVSAKHYDVLLKIFPHFSGKISYITNGVNIERWMKSNIREAYESLGLTIDRLAKLKEKNRGELEKYLQNYKKDVVPEGKFVVLWARRITEYKRPWMVIRLAKDLKDMPILFILGGKSHPNDHVGLEYMKLFKRLHNEMNNVIFVHDYDIAKAMQLLPNVDLLLFTPFSGLESCGTSYMKAAINAVPSIASRDGAALEFIVHGVNGWLFGEDLREPIEIYSQRASEINEKEYAELRETLVKVYKIFREEPEWYYAISLSALRSFVPRVSMSRVLREYYPELIKLPII
ncbi:MAG: glycogen/starch/alpha-glucan phosphorylase [Ignisphaera sp.]|nr:glycogen/starch/alpha-glucan phosphorylase [Ignisphaera sp.]MDW8084743.1 glycogen/starch/alpha-glucan phosphorylase [Ignisphaera sp.]